jgi:3-hydroxyisobutyrate dehydrogenase-like beta-hydroxyacid dehydrogenase
MWARREQPLWIHRDRPHRPLVESMLRVGLQVTVFDLDPEPLQAIVDQGAVGATSVAELARSSDVVGICVPADAHVRAVLEPKVGSRTC